jgi:CRP-like cAMP-binding protein
MFGRNNKLDTAWLGSLGFFEGFTDAELNLVSGIGEKLEIAAGTEFIDQGRVGDSCFVIVDGRAAIYIRGEFITSVRSGSMVGEMALVEHRPRNASVVAETDMVLVRFGTAEFRKLLDGSPNANERVNSMLNARIRENEARDA